MSQLVRNAVASVKVFSLAPIPLFILMGEIMFHSGMAFRAIDAVDKLIARVPGRLSLVAVCSGTIFSTLSGSTMANTAILGSVLLPEMRKRGYHPTIAIGPILGTGGIAMLIPPSALAVLLASLAQIPIAELLIAGIAPGLLIAALFFLYIVVRCRLDPKLAPSYDLDAISFSQRLVPFFLYVVPLLTLFVLVVGSILFGLGDAVGIGGAGRGRRRRRGGLLSLFDLGGVAQVDDGNGESHRYGTLHYLCLDHLLADPRIFRCCRRPA